MFGKRIAVGGGGGATADFWKTIAVPGQTSITADINNDTLTLTPGSGIGITTFPATDTILIYETINISGSVGQHLNDNVPLIFGTDADSRIVFSSAQLTPTGTLVIGVPDASGAGISNARSLIVCDEADVNTDLSLPPQNNPTIGIADAGMSKAFLLWNDGTDSHIQAWPSGNIVFHNNFLPSASGTLDIGSASMPVRSLYLTGSSLHIGAVELTSNGEVLNFQAQTISGTGDIYAGNFYGDGTTLTGLMPLAGGTFTGDITLASGVDILAVVSGTNDIGTAALPFQNIYADTLYGDGSNLTGVVSAHSALTELDYASAGHTGFMPVVGGTFIGNVYFGANSISGTGTVTMGTLDVTNCVASDILPCVSGSQDVGSSVKPWNEVHAASIQSITSTSGEGTLVLGEATAIEASYVEIFDGGTTKPGYVKLYSEEGTPYYLVTASGGGFYVDDGVPDGIPMANWTFSSTVLGFGAYTISGTGDIYAGNFYGDGSSLTGLMPLAGGTFTGDVTFADGKNILAAVSGTNDIGTTTFPFGDIYTHDGQVHISDERMKESRIPSPLGLDFICRLDPIQYKWKDDPKVYKRKHYGFTAQQVKAVLDDLGINTNDFAGYIYESDGDSFGLRYIEFIAPMAKAIQELKAEHTESIALMAKAFQELKAEVKILKDS